MDDMLLLTVLMSGWAFFLFVTCVAPYIIDAIRHHQGSNK